MNLLVETRKTYLKTVRACKRKEKRIEVKIENLQSEINTIQEKIKTEKSKKDKVSYDDTQWWGDALMKPIIDEIAQRENLTLDNKKLMAFGMKSHVTAFFYKIRKNGKKGKLMYSLTFLPHDLKKGIMQIETTKTKHGGKHDYAKNPNGFDLIDIDCPDTIDGIIKFMKSKENK